MATLGDTYMSAVLYKLLVSMFQTVDNSLIYLLQIIFCIKVDITKLYSNLKGMEGHKQEFITMKILSISSVPNKIKLTVHSFGRLFTSEHTHYYCYYYYYTINNDDIVDT